MIGCAGQAVEREGAASLTLLPRRPNLNVLKEELPEERRSSFWAFCVGVVVCTALLMLA